MYKAAHGKLREATFALHQEATGLGLLVVLLFRFLGLDFFLLLVQERGSNQSSCTELLERILFGFVLALINSSVDVLWSVWCFLGTRALLQRQMSGGLISSGDDFVQGEIRWHEVHTVLSQEPLHILGGDKGKVPGNQFSPTLKSASKCIIRVECVRLGLRLGLRLGQRDSKGPWGCIHGVVVTQTLGQARGIEELTLSSFGDW